MKHGTIAITISTATGDETSDRRDKTNVQAVGNKTLSARVLRAQWDNNLITRAVDEIEHLTSHVIDNVTHAT